MPIKSSGIMAEIPRILVVFAERRMPPSWMNLTASKITAPSMNVASGYARASVSIRLCPGCPRQESNLHPALRRRVLYPLSYEGFAKTRGYRRGVPNLP